MGGSSGSDGSNIYQYANSGSADSGAVSGAQALTSAGSSLQNLYGSAAGGLSNLTQGTNYNPQFGVNAGYNMAGATSQLPGYANQALATGFNANNGLYNQELGQVNDQTNSALAARGISMSPYGASVQASQDQQFNNQWNTQQLQNQSTAAGTASSLLGAYNSGQSGGATTAQGSADNSLNSLQSLLTSGNLSTGDLQSAISDYLSYLSGGTQASSAQASAANAQEQASNTGWAGLGSLAGQIL